MGEEPVPEADFAAAVDARRAGGRAGQPHGRARRPGHAVRGAHRGRLPRAGPARGGGGRDRGRAGRALRRHQRDPVEGAGAHLGRARAHALARPDGHRHRRGEAGRGARPRDAGGRASSTPSRAAVAERVARERHATLVQAPPPDRGAPLRAAGGFQRAQLRAGRGRRRGVPRPALDPDAVAARRGRDARSPAASRSVADDPLTVYDGAHNPAGARALAESLDEVLGDRRPRVAVIGVLEDKDAAGMLARAAAAASTASSHALAQPALAVARHARVAGREAGRPARGDGRRPARGAWPARGRWRARTAPCWPPARST